MPVPNFFLVGGPRCGSTFLYHYLEQHPDIFFSARKETHFFSKDFHAECDELQGERGKEMTIFSIRDEQEYLDQYADCGAATTIGDASTSHLYSRVAAQGIAEFNPEAKILISIRNPVDQMRSWHSYLVRHREEPVTNFAEAVRRNAMGLAAGDYSNALRHATRINYRYITDYGMHLERFRQYFSDDQILVVVFDDFMVNPAREFRQIMEFLGVDPNIADELNYEKRNTNKQLMFASLFGRLVNRDSFLRKIGDAILPRSFAKTIHSRLITAFTTSHERPDDNREAVSELREELRPRIARLGSLIDRDLVSLWGFDGDH
ncbi:MAG: sulfotransferase [Gammaproteobacteria bacterium]|jgi:hypothetical protein|nr:sulfotransferase [Gammaproteobacteria bacterium]MDP6616596.1 sulfotransferase [Gammaproteobacteria bacterium]MDP6694793.1 sulfotransferase [Gammaproteobacteria bacterium]